MKQNDILVKSYDKISFLNFIENCFNFIRKFKILNWLNTVNFFIILIILIYTQNIFDNTEKSKKLKISDYFSFIVSFTGERIAEKQILDSLKLGNSLVVCIIFTFFICGLFTTIQAPWIKNLYSIIWFYVIPFFYTRVINIFIRGESLISKYGYSLQISLSIFSHLFFVIVFGFGSFITSISPDFLINPFVCQNPISGFFISAYISSVSHLASPFLPFSSTVISLRIFLSIVFFFIFLIKNPYL